MVAVRERRQHIRHHNGRVRILLILRSVLTGRMSRLMLHTTSLHEVTANMRMGNRQKEAYLQQDLLEKELLMAIPSTETYLAVVQVRIRISLASGTVRQVM